MKIYWSVVSCFMLSIILNSCDETVETQILSQSDAFSFTAMPEVATRATDIAFEEGDKIGVYAVKRHGNNVGTLLSSGNFADNKQYVFQDGHFVPVTPDDIIYAPTGEKTDFYAYYPYQPDIDPTALSMDVQANQSEVTNYKASDYLWSRAEGGYITTDKPINFIFSHIMGKIEVIVNKGGASVNSGNFFSYLSQKGNLQTGTLQITSSSKSSVNMLLGSENDAQYVFWALVPGGDVIASGDEFSFITSDGTKKYVTSKEYDIISGKTNRFVMDVITWNYTFTASPSVIGFESKGGSKPITITSYRTKVLNGVPTAVTEPVSYTTSITGSGATGYNVSGNSVIASENHTTDYRDATLIITQDGGNTSPISINLEQEPSIDIDTEV